MSKPAGDQRSSERRDQDERVASEPRRAALDIPPGTQPTPVESHLARVGRRPLAVAGIVENGLVRPLDASVKLPEHARVIIVASEGT